MQFTLLQNEQGENWWTIKLCPSSPFSLIEQLHKSVTIQQFKKCNEDPHLSQGLKNGELWAIISSPINLGAKWIESVIKLLLGGETLYVNKTGGFYLKDDKVQEKENVESDSWPEFKVRGTLKIQRWKGGSHFYITAHDVHGSGFIDSNIKYDTYDEAYQVALKYAAPEQIKFEESESYYYKNLGD